MRDNIHLSDAEILLTFRTALGACFAVFKWKDRTTLQGVGRVNMGDDVRECGVVHLILKIIKM